MRAKLIDLATGIDGKQRVTFSVDADLRELMDQFTDCELELTIKKYRKRRSRDANAYCWVLLDKLSEALNLSREEIYRQAVLNIGGVSEIVCVRTEAVDKLCDNWRAHGIGWQTDTMPSKLPGCTNVILYYGSSTYDTKQMSALIDLLVQECRQLGIETMTPDEIASLEAAWQG